MSARVLLVEDDHALRTGLTDTLRDEGYQVATAADGNPGQRALAEDGDFDLVVLDVMLPGPGGLELLRGFRARNASTPVLLLTARGAESDKVLGLELGADDYVTKPFSLRELLARLRALLRRGERAHADHAARFALGDAAVDLGAFRVTRGAAATALSPTEAAMLQLLWERRGEVVSRRAFLALVWPGNVRVGPRTVDTHVLNLRHKLEPDPKKPRYLLTVHGAGYRLTDSDRPSTASGQLDGRGRRPWRHEGVCREVLDRAELLVVALRHPQSDVRLVAVEKMQAPLDDELASLVVELFPFPSDEASDHQVRTALILLEDSDVALAGEAVRRLLSSDRDYRAEVFRHERAVDELSNDEVAALFTDRNWLVRLRAAAAMARRADRVGKREIANLLRLMREGPVESVREAAEQALASIRFYNEQKAHWDRVFAGTATGPAAAAAALLDRAKEDRPKNVRLLAIQSLGTLGQPETLPFLIDWSQSDDPDIAAAASAAVAEINAR